MSDERREIIMAVSFWGEREVAKKKRERRRCHWKRQEKRREEKCVREVYLKPSINPQNLLRVFKIGGLVIMVWTCHSGARLFEMLKNTAISFHICCNFLGDVKRRSK